MPPAVGNACKPKHDRLTRIRIFEGLRALGYEGGWPLFNMRRLAGMMNGWIVEWHLGMVAVGETLFADAPAPVDGWLDIPDRPGLGLTLDADAWRETRVELEV